MKRLIGLAAVGLALGVLAACGDAASTQTDGTTATTTPTSASATPQAGHSAQPGEPALVQVPGFEYRNVVGPASNACKMFSEEIVSSCSVHRVSGLPRGVMFAMGFNPTLNIGSTMEKSMVRSMASSGAREKVVTVAGQKVVLAQPAGTRALIAGWSDAGVMYIAQSSDGDLLEQFVTGFIEGSNS